MNCFHNFPTNLKLLKKKPLFLWTCCILIIAATLSVSFWNFKTREKLKKTYEVRLKLALISSNEKEELEYLFRYLMYHSSFVYVLFGDKPMSFESFIKTEDVWKYFMRNFTSFEPGLEFCKFQRGWAAWKKYKHLFPLKKFILVHQEEPIFLGYMSIFFVHKKNLLKTMREHAEDFKDILGEGFNPEEILDCFYKNVITMDKKLKRHPVLQGILLGYGKENAWNYYNLSKFRYKMSKDPSAYEEFRKAQEKFVPFSTHNYDLECPIYLPMFGCDPKSKETLNLKRKYKKQRADIYKKYQEGDFLEVTLLKLTEEF
jgi:hypothetical protein